MRVMQAMAGARHGGAEEFFVRLVIALHRAGLDQRVIIRKNDARAARLKDAGINPVELFFGGALDLVTPWHLRRQLADYRPDIVLTWMNRATSKMPRSSAVHVARLGGFYDLKYYRRCDHLVGNTKGIVDYLVNAGWPAEKAHYLPNFADQAPGIKIGRDVLGVPEDAPLLLALGRLHENKAFDVLISALPTVPSAHLLLAGEGPLRQELTELAKNVGVEDRVTFLGWRDDIPDLLTSADILVCPSRHEPLGNVVLEGWSHKKPVVAAASQGPSELIIDGKTGILVPVDDVQAMSDALGRAIADPDHQSRLAGAAFAAYEATFSEQAVVAEYLKFFQKLVP